MKLQVFMLTLALAFAAQELSAQRPQVPPQQRQGPPPGVAGQGAPDWLPLPADHQKYLDQILAYWEHTTKSTERYRCTFKRWEYEPQLKTYSEGVIKYASPDKGLFQVELIKNRIPAAAPDAEPTWKPGEFKEHWVCDGQSIFEFDYNNKQLKQRQLPQDMRGKRITDGPLPFLFGATAAQIKSRLWLRVITPKKAKGEFWLEGVPRTQQDAANFARIHIILDETDFLPKGMVLFHRNQAQTTFAFEKRETNWSAAMERLNVFHRQFYEPKPYPGWKKVVEPLAPQASPGIGPGASPVRQARPPARGPLRR